MLSLNQTYLIFSEKLLRKAAQYREKENKAATKLIIASIKDIYTKALLSYLDSNVKATPAQRAATLAGLVDVIEKIRLRLDLMSAYTHGTLGYLVPPEAVTQIKRCLELDLTRNTLVKFTGAEKARRAANFYVISWWLEQIKDIESLKNIQIIIAALLESESFGFTSWLGTNRLTKKLKKAYDDAHKKYILLETFFKRVEDILSEGDAKYYHICDSALDYPGRIIKRLQTLGITEPLTAFIAARDNPHLCTDEPEKWQETADKSLLNFNAIRYTLSNTKVERDGTQAVFYSDTKKAWVFLFGVNIRDFNSFTLAHPPYYATYELALQFLELKRTEQYKIIEKALAAKKTWQQHRNSAQDSLKTATAELISAGDGNPEISRLINLLLKPDSASIRLMLAEQMVEINEFISNLQKELPHAFCKDLAQRLRAALPAMAGAGVSVVDKSIVAESTSVEIADGDDDPKAVESPAESVSLASLLWSMPIERTPETMELSAMFGAT